MKKTVLFLTLISVYFIKAQAQYWTPSNSVTTSTGSPVNITIPTGNTNTTAHLLIQRNVPMIPPSPFNPQNYFRIQRFNGGFPPVVPSSVQPIFTINNEGYTGMGIDAPTSPLHVSTPFDYNARSFYFTTDGKPSKLIISNPATVYDRQLFYVNRLFQKSYGNMPKTDDQGLFWSDGKNKVDNVVETLYDENGEIITTPPTLYVTKYYNATSGFVIAPWYNPATSTTDFRGMRIDAAGKVSINSSNNFGYTLAVNGTVGAKEIELDVNTAWPDYVFDSNYQLYSFDQLRAYINKNHHLPDIAAASKMQDQKMNVAEMNITLLRKVEELSLYILQLEERMKKLETAKQ